MLRALIHLTEDEREAFIDHTLVGRSYSAIGKDLDLSVSRVQQIVRSAETKLTKILAPMGRAA